MSKVDFVIITGLSGAGKTQAMKVLEDLHFFCIDNLPPALLPRLVELHVQGQTDRQYAIAIDVRVREFFGDLRRSLEWLEQSGHSYIIIFLDCADEVLIKRFSETRRLHPLVKGKTEAESIFRSIAEERKQLAEAREMAHVVLDTTDLRPMDLRVRISEIFAGVPLQESVLVDVFSFGYKYGAPIDADIVFDVRFIPNPFYVDELRPLTGQDAQVSDYVLRFPVTQLFLERFTSLVCELLPNYAKEGKARLTIGIGCTGGQHRSVAIANEVAKRLEECRIKARARHRELGWSIP
ncbi:MAG TPA: RNase adapter RapZ [Firmicutes bacterium]|nr:RNase adapter RapZ [Bacillota bacterium]